MDEQNNLENQPISQLNEQEANGSVDHSFADITQILGEVRLDRESENSYEYTDADVPDNQEESEYESDNIQGRFESNVDDNSVRYKMDENIYYSSFGPQNPNYPDPIENHEEFSADTFAPDPEPERTNAAVGCTDLPLDGEPVAKANIVNPVVPISPYHLDKALREIFSSKNKSEVSGWGSYASRPSLSPKVYADVTFKSSKPFSEAMWVTHFNNLVFLKNIEPEQIKWSKSHTKIGASKSVTATFELTGNTTQIEAYKYVYVMKASEKRAINAKLQADMTITNVNSDVIVDKVVIRRSNPYGESRAEVLSKTSSAGFPQILSAWDPRTVYAKIKMWNALRNISDVEERVAYVANNSGVIKRI